MTDMQRGPGPTAAILTVILPFVESSDARLRSNAMHALAALVTKSDQKLAKQAEQLLLRALMSDLGNVGADSQRRFLQRAFDALGRIPDEARFRIANEADKKLKNATEPAERARIAGLLVAARAAGCLPAVGWATMLRLTFDAGRAGVLRTVWTVIWRMVVATLLFGIVINIVFELNTDNLIARLYDIWILGSLCLLILACLSLSGRAEQAQHLRSVDIIISATVFSILAGLGTLLLVNTGARTDWPLFQKAFALLDRRSLIATAVSCLLGFLIGGGLRSMRWIAEVYAIESEELKSGTRAALAVLAATFACRSASMLGMDASSAGAAWVALVPTSAVAAFLDVWLERQPPHSLLPSQKKHYVPGIVQFAIIIAAATALVTMTFFVNSIKRAMPPSDPSFEQVAISFPDDSLQSGNETVETWFGVPARFNIEHADQYQITTQAPGDPVLRIFDKEGGLVAEVDHPALPKYVGRLSEGRYYACVVKFKSISRTVCDQFSIVDSAAMLMGQKARATAPDSEATKNNARDVRITLSRVSK